MSTIHLNKLLDPQSIVVVGASDREGSPGRAVCANIINGNYTGELFFVNPRYKTVLDQPCFKSLSKLDKACDIALILVPEKIIKRTLVQVARAGIKVAIVMSAVRNHIEIHQLAQRLSLRLLGPYCAGIIRPHLKLNASFAQNKIKQGSLAIVTQSASLGAAIVDWAQPSSVGFSTLVSTGSDTDISLSDVLDLLAEDYHTRGIIIYLDRIHHTRSFLSAVSAAARIKPVVLMKSTQDTARYCDALTRSGHIYSTETVMQAAMRRTGVVRVRTFSNLFSAAKILTSAQRIKGNRLAIVSNGAAPAMLACERIATKRFSLPALSKDTTKTLHTQLRSYWSGTNPVVLRHPEQLAEQYTNAIRTLVDSKDYDAILVIFVPDARNEPLQVADAIIACANSATPLLSCFMGESSVAPSRERFAENKLPCFRTPEAATDAADFLYRYLQSQQQLVQLPNPTSRYTRADIEGARKIIDTALADNERVLGPQKTRALLKLFDINVLPAIRATNLNDATEAAADIGYPVALKLVSPNITYKAAVEGIQLNINDEPQLTKAYNHIVDNASTLRPDAHFRGVLIEAMHPQANERSLAVSITRDATFGPVISVSIGGELAAILQTRSMQLPPLNQYLIDDLFSSPELDSYFGDYRHKKPVSKKQAAHVLRRISEIACELPEVFSLHINPLQVSDKKAVAMDVQLVLEKNDCSKRYDHLAIHPYPWQWLRQIELKYGKLVQLRPIRPEDGESIKSMVKNMSAESRYFRFMHAINELSPQMVAQFTKLDYDRQMAFVAVSDNGSGQVVGVSRYAMSTDKQSGEFAVSIANDWQGLGLATKLMALIIEHARYQGIKELVGDVLMSNTGMRALMKSMGFTSAVSKENREVLVFTLSLTSTSE